MAQDIVLNTDATTCLSPELPVGITTGDLLPALSENAIQTGNLLIANPIEAEPWPLNHARIGYDNILLDNISAAGGVQGGINGGSETVDNLLSAATFSKWRTLDLTTPDARFLFNDAPANYIALASHNFGDSVGAVNVYTTADNGGSWTLRGTINPVNNNPIYFSFTESTINGVRVTASTISAPIELGVLFVGVELIMMRPIYGGHKPVDLNATDSYTPAMSDGGQFLGRTVVRKGFKTSADFKNLKAPWYRSDFQPFVEHAKKYPYFFIWNPAEYPDVIAYAWTNGNIAPSNMGIRDLMEVTVSIEAYG